MSDAATETPEPINEPEVASVGIVAQIKTDVAVGVTSGRVYKTLIDAMANDEVAARAALLKKGYELLLKHANDLNSIRPKSPGVGEDEKPLPPIYTTDDAKKRKTIKEKIARLDAVFTKVMDPAAKKDTWRAFEDALGKNASEKS